MRKFPYRRMRMAARRRRQDLIWVPFISPCVGTSPAQSCEPLVGPTMFELFNNSSWQPDAALDAAWDKATLKRLICCLSWNGAPSEQTEGGAFIYGIVKQDFGVGAGLTAWSPSHWSTLDTLWGPAVQTVQAFAANPITIDIQTKRKLDTNDQVFLAVQGNEEWSNLVVWVSGRALLERA